MASAIRSKILADVIRVYDFRHKFQSDRLRYEGNWSAVDLDGREAIGSGGQFGYAIDTGEIAVRCCENGFHGSTPCECETLTYPYNHGKTGGSPAVDYTRGVKGYRFFASLSHPWLVNYLTNLTNLINQANNRIDGVVTNVNELTTRVTNLTTTVNNNYEEFKNHTHELKLIDDVTVEINNDEPILIAGDNIILERTDDGKLKISATGGAGGDFPEAPSDAMYARQGELNAEGEVIGGHWVREWAKLPLGKVDDNS
jgi:hypothetical protein